MCPLLVNLEAVARIAQIKAQQRRYYSKDGMIFELGCAPLDDFGPQQPRQPDSPKRQSHQERLEARYLELEREAERVAKREKMEVACRSCLHGRDIGAKSWAWVRCAHPLVAGFDGPRYVDRDQVKQYCTDERLLWEPRPTRWERFIAWLEGLFA